MQKYLAEFLGTGVFVYVIVATMNPAAMGITLAIIVLLLKDVSGGHINPAVSLAMASYGKLDTNELIPYIFSQLAGGLIGLEIFKQYPIPLTSTMI